MSGHGMRGAVVGWYLPVLVVDEKQMKKRGGVSVVVMMKRTAGGFEQAVGIRSRQEWYRYKMNRKQLVGARPSQVRKMVAARCQWRGRRFGKNGQGRQWKTQSGGGRPRGSGGRRSKQQCEGVGQRTWKETRYLTEVEQGQRHGRRGVLAAPCYVWSHFYYPLLTLVSLMFIYGHPLKTRRVSLLNQGCNPILSFGHPLGSNQKPFGLIKTQNRAAPAAGKNN